MIGKSFLRIPSTFFRNGGIGLKRFTNVFCSGSPVKNEDEDEYDYGGV
jgi:hypothetical protein